MVRDKSKLPISVQDNKKVKLMVCDIRESYRYKKEISQINYLIHTATAWGDPRRAYEVNIKAFEELLEMLDIEKLEKIIYFSTASILDTQTELMRESLIMEQSIFKQNMNVSRNLEKAHLQKKLLLFSLPWFLEEILEKKVNIP